MKSNVLFMKSILLQHAFFKVKLLDKENDYSGRQYKNHGRRPILLVVLLMLFTFCGVKDISSFFCERTLLLYVSDTTDKKELARGHHSHACAGELRA